MAMVKARYYTADGGEQGNRELPGDLFDGVVNESVLHQVVKAHLANQRQGTAAAKNRSAVRGGSRKPWRQKGTGRARQGTIRAPQWVGGGRVFPPQPHSWRQKVPRKVRALARRSAFNARAQDDRVVLMDLPEFETPKTRRLMELLESVGAEGRVLVLTDGVRENMVLSARNVQEVKVLTFGQESAYDLLLAGTVIIEGSALNAGEAATAAPVKKAEPVPAEEEAAAAEEAPAAEAEADEDAEVNDA
jgi:large subunit ribosomal protein L4